MLHPCLPVSRSFAQVNMIQVEACICAMAFIKWKYLCIIKQIANRDNVWVLSTIAADDDSLHGMPKTVAAYHCKPNTFSSQTSLPNENGNLYLFRLLRFVAFILFALLHFISFVVCVSFYRRWQTIHIQLSFFHSKRLSFRYRNRCPWSVCACAS